MGDSTKLVSQWRLDSWLMVLGVILTFDQGVLFFAPDFRLPWRLFGETNWIFWILSGSLCDVFKSQLTIWYKRKQTRNSLFFMVSSLSDINSCFWHSGVVTLWLSRFFFCKILACSFERLVGFYWSSKTGTWQVIRGHVIAKRSPLLLGSVTIYSNTKVFPLNKTPVY